MDNSLLRFLVEHQYVFCEGNVSAQIDDETAYYNTFLFTNFGINLDRPECASKEIINQICGVYPLSAPNGFYNNPQDTTYFDASELLIEQLVSYFAHDYIDRDLGRIEIFKKDLPYRFKSGLVRTYRTFKVLYPDEVDVVLKEAAKNFCSYTRPWSITDSIVITSLIHNNYISEDLNISCKENIFKLIEETHNYNYAKKLDYKDLVKFSVKLLGDFKKLKACDADALEILKNCLENVRFCELSKKQAKYFNKICQLCGNKLRVSNKGTVFARADQARKANDIISMASILAQSGSLYERNIRMLLSRAKEDEIGYLLSLISDENPIVLAQLISKINCDSETRTFTFTKNHLLKKHIETDEESTKRRSCLTEKKRKLLVSACVKKVFDHYQQLPSLGKVYIDNLFKDVAVPFNTSASGSGINVKPTGSRIGLISDKIRSFVYWKDAYDIDASLILVKEDGSTEVIYYGNYSYASGKDSAVQFSGDCRSKDGAEYFDIDLNKLREEGYKYVIQAINGFGASLNEGEIFAGYKTEFDFNAEVWDPSNIAFKYQVKGNTREAINFAIDIEACELIILNQVVEGACRTVNGSSIYSITKQYLDRDFLRINMYEIIANRGQVVNDPEFADIIFSDVYMSDKEVVHSYDIEKLVAIINEKNN